jgi:hypothetical protein
MRYHVQLFSPNNVIAMSRIGARSPHLDVFFFEFCLEADPSAEPVLNDLAMTLAV